MATTPQSEMVPSAFPPGQREVVNLFEQLFRAGEKSSEQPSVRSRTVPFGRWMQAIYVLIDLFFVGLNATIVLTIRFVSLPVLAQIWFKPLDLVRILPMKTYLAFFLLYSALIVLCCAIQDLYVRLDNSYGKQESWNVAKNVAKAVTVATLLLAVFIYLSGHKDISRLWVGCSAVLNVATLIAWRQVFRHVVTRRVEQGIGARNAVIVGAGKMGQALAQYLDCNKRLGYLIKGFLDQNHNGDPRILGKIEDLARIARAHFIDEVFVTIPSEREVVRRVALVARMNHLSVKVLPEFYDGLGWNVPMERLGDFPVFVLHREPIPTLGLFFKRTTDVVVATLGLVLAAPLCALISVRVKLDSKGPVLYRHRRVGRKGRPFYCFKFRTMVVDADVQKERMRHLNERQGPFFKVSDDPRITKVGKFLRRYSLDEIPQLWNVLRGEMSLVGPRPPEMEEIVAYRLDHLRRLDVTPGVTGLWQVSARHDPSFETAVALDSRYIENWNLALDFKILLKTIPVVLRGEGQ
jgi:exopolysaccharide biosynthesis polyprenyl glycosylphosphotransferase